MLFPSYIRSGSGCAILFQNGVPTTHGLTNVNKSGVIHLLKMRFSGGLYLADFVDFCADEKLRFTVFNPCKNRKIPLSIEQVRDINKFGCDF